MDHASRLFSSQAKPTKAAAEYLSSDSSSDEDSQVPSYTPNDNEFHGQPRKRRRTGGNAKERAALGVFGSDSEDDWRFSSKRLRTKTVSFVSSRHGEPYVQEQEHEAKGQEDDADGDLEMASPESDVGEPDQDDDKAEFGRLGLGHVAARVAAQGKDTPRRTSKTLLSEGNGPLGMSFMPSSASIPQLKVANDEPPQRTTAKASAFVQERKGKTSINEGSFAARMMAKMGYKDGQGLGKSGAGRSRIVEAVLRPQGIGLGAVSEISATDRKEQVRLKRLAGETVPDSDDDEKKGQGGRKIKTRVSGKGSAAAVSNTRKRKIAFSTIDEVKKAAPGLNIPEAFTPILDLRGPGARLLTSSSELVTPANGEVHSEDDGNVESRKLVRRAQNDFMGILEEWKSLQERKAYIDLQLGQEQRELDDLLVSLHVNNAMVHAGDRVAQESHGVVADQKAHVTDQINLVVAQLQAATKEMAPDELSRVRGELSMLAVGAIHPLLSAYMDVWEPLREPTPPFLDGLKSIRALLGADQAPRRGQGTPWHALMYKIWLPAVAAVVRKWSVQDSEQLLDVLRGWEDLMPAFVRSRFLADVQRRLEEAVRTWEPRRKESCNVPSVWVFPWLQHLPAHHLDPSSSTGIVADLRRKFKQLMDVWDYGRGVIPGLAAWKGLLQLSKGQDHWGPLVLHHLLPALAKYVGRHFRVDPQDQGPYLQYIEAMVKWLDGGIITPSMLAEMLVAEVFPDWHAKLYQWLLMEDVNLEEIGLWLDWWTKDVFPDSVSHAPSVKAEFDRGAALVEQALVLGDQTRAWLRPLPRRAAGEKRHHKDGQDGHGQKRRDRKEHVEERQPEEVTFRHVMEDWCQDNDLQFIPERKKVHAQGPLYRITARGDGKGGVLVFFKGDILVILKGAVETSIRRENVSDWETLINLAS